MRLVLLAKDHQSGDKGCPSVSDDLDSADFIVLGQREDTAGMPNVLPGEVAIRINRDIIIEAVRHYGTP